ncbi:MULTISPECIES: hypothetical protein [Streptomycetaceae]|uniref:hypothetical protein n=1 Tax=Streptomycetaceae TaxID=2062 RepID=UPI001E5B1657|nr:MULTISPECIES: hypothetical protein [Streptomycetaceae]
MFFAVTVKVMPSGPTQLFQLTELTLANPVPESPEPLFSVPLAADEVQLSCVPVLLSVRVGDEAVAVNAPPGVTVHVAVVEAEAGDMARPADAATAAATKALLVILRTG